MTGIRIAKIRAVAESTPFPGERAVALALIMRQTGKRRKGKRPQSMIRADEWAAMDWDLSDAELARRTGRQQLHVTNQRRYHGRPRREFVPALALLVGSVLWAGASTVTQGTVKVALAWDAPAGGVTVAGYALYAGRAAGAYTNRQDIGTNRVYRPSWGATGLFWYAATAYNASGLESAYSEPLCVRVAPCSTPPGQPPRFQVILLVDGPPAPPAPPVYAGWTGIVDSVDALYSPAAGWALSTSPTFYGGSCRHDNKQAKGTKSATFTATVPRAGVYRLSVPLVPGTTRSANTPHTVAGIDAVFAPVPVDQRILGEGWQTVGEFSLRPGSVTVTISTGGTVGYVIADAVKWEWVSE